MAESSGSIPARAGQPIDVKHDQSLLGVYPRTRGATLTGGGATVSYSGLSPHARGNPHHQTELRGPDRSIPARAGQPPAAASIPPSEWVYPRTRGATASFAFVACPTTGLSPHARGNPGMPNLLQGTLRSIPARAGQPAGGTPCPNTRGVYPRTRGATASDPTHQRRRRGLSPHARGNPQVSLGGDHSLGSIPARAGQPSGVRTRCEHSRVYPRTRGATLPEKSTTPAADGLSPHARGNLDRDSRNLGITRSIPARAGQPYAWRDMEDDDTVYPRTRGATGVLEGPYEITSGLSPHARGNLITSGIQTLGQGSIPARAGQP